ncbi:hypothetical protein GCM10009687_05420 [Asanoa iriomotensis]|uniref:Uncharacterized protein n=1 Tax=Asanoa iriomotensis TaxID=234613 RepID=A0ABQ4C7Y7_9ACTN|nr:hypothetical protein Air01nite_49890 [Asanoa iriomotensis]
MPSAEQPLRVAEFQSLFAGAAESVDRIDDRHARITLRGGPGLEEAVRDLAARESGCCAFFGFTVTAAGLDIVTLDVEVPASHADVLDGLARLAEAA